MALYYSGVRLAARGLFRVLAGCRVRGRQHVPLDGGLVVASNHISFWDPPLIGAALPREMYYLAKTELFSTPGLGWIIRSLNAIPVRRGAADLTGLSRAIGVVREGGALLLFPEGSRMHDGALHPARPGVGMIAVQADVPVVSCFISGSNRPSRWVYRGARVRIRFGRVRHWRDLAGAQVDQPPGRALYQAVGDAVMRDIAVLKTEQENEASRGAA